MSSNSPNKRTRRINKSTTFPSDRPNRRVSPPTSTATLVDADLFTEFEALQISPESPNPRSFPYSVKQQCWEKAEKIKGRDPERWRRDPLGNTVFRKLVGCPGCLCHDYDHILPYSKGGKSTLENCQVLQATVNRSKGNRTEMSKSELIQKSAYCRVSAISVVIKYQTPEHSCPGPTKKNITRPKDKLKFCNNGANVTDILL